MADDAKEIERIATSLTKRFVGLMQEKKATIKPPPSRIQVRTHAQKQMIDRLLSTFEQFKFYEDQDLQARAREVIPIERLHEQARELQSSHQEDDFEDALVRCLTRWFKHEFFAWVNEPPCQYCNSPARGIGMTTPSSDELKFGAHRVELYQCSQCSKHTRFPRFNHPGKLLETRRGRCGEWANCFTLCLRAMGYDARYVLDWTDHVWNEYYSEHKKRWIHIDSCENAVDTPLIYEAGWGKKLSYIFAFTHHEVRDVLRRYTKNIKDCLTRRNDVKERWLLKALHVLSQQRQKSLPPSTTQVFLARQLSEETEFLLNMFDHQLKEDELLGRQSGSLAWRLERGEIREIETRKYAAQGDTWDMETIKKGHPVYQSSGSDQVSVSQVHLVGNARKTSLRVAPENVVPCFSLLQRKPNQRSALYFASQLSLKKPLIISFKFRVSALPNSQLADGFALVIQSESLSALGEGGGGLGFQGLKKSVAVEFDFYENGEEKGMGDNHISIHERGDSSSNGVVQWHDVKDLGNVNRQWTCDIVWNCGAIRVYVNLHEADDKLTKVLETKIDTVKVFGTPDAEAWVGFTGATGGFSCGIEIWDWSIYGMVN